MLKVVFLFFAVCTAQIWADCIDDFKTKGDTFLTAVDGIAVGTDTDAIEKGTCIKDKLV